MDDDTIAMVIGVTATTPEKAAQYLHLADGDAGQAINLFFENGGADLSSGSADRAPAKTSTNPQAPGNSDNPIDLDDIIDDDNDPEVTGFRKAGNQNTEFDQDAEMARRMQEEMYNGAGQEDEIRAPIARQAETLMGPGADIGIGMGDPGVNAAIQQRMLQFQNRRGQGFRAGIFNQQPATSSIWNEDDSERDTLALATGGASEGSSKSNTLARLYQPPWELMFKEPWDKAREQGREDKKWLLVNIQDGSVFDCQILNRDLWKNASVVDTVRENFLFLQYSKEDVRAQEYIQYYFPLHANSDMYPHIAIVDPRTGEQVKLWSREVPKPADFLMQLHEFLDRYSLDTNKRNPVAKRKSETKKTKTIDQMSEEEMLEKALQESMASQSAELKPPAVEDPDDLTRSITDLRNDSDMRSVTENGDEPVPATPFSLIPSNRPHTEPANGPNVTRIQLRHPAGRIIRRFTLNEHVQTIYEFLKAEPLEGKQGVEFELVSMGKNLIDSVDETIETAKLKNGTVMIEFLEG